MKSDRGLLQALVFDFDGVIANSEPLHYRGFRDVLAEVGVTLSEQDYYGKYLGYDDLGVFKAVSADRGFAWSTNRLAQFVSLKARRLAAAEHEGADLFPGADVAIRSAAQMLPLAIASGALRAEILRVVERERLASCFKAIVAAEDTPLSKPAPDPYARAVTLLGEASRRTFDPARCVAIEDSPWGLQSARAAGLRTVAVAQTYDRNTLDADLVIASIKELDLAALERLVVC